LVGSGRGWCLPEREKPEAFCWADKLGTTKISSPTHVKAVIKSEACLPLLFIT
jgi:hypothetical protein